MLIYTQMIIMGSKTISLDEEAYEQLRNQKRGNESFSDVVKRITRPVHRKSLLEFAGAWDFTDDEEQKLLESLGTFRKGLDEDLS
ncbi:MAG: antitoxin VapB family protein [Candidatus Hodarchaeales archaeon]